MNATASRITAVSIVCSNRLFRQAQIKDNIKAPPNWSVTRKMSPFGGDIMELMGFVTLILNPMKYDLFTLLWW